MFNSTFGLIPKISLIVPDEEGFFAHKNSPSRVTPH
jgi:hypothetical protein